MYFYMLGAVGEKKQSHLTGDQRSINSASTLHLELRFCIVLVSANVSERGRATLVHHDLFWTSFGASFNRSNSDLFREGHVDNVD